MILHNFNLQNVFVHIFDGHWLDQGPLINLALVCSWCLFCIHSTRLYSCCFTL